MLKRRSSKFLGLLATLALAIVLSACGNSGSGSGSSDAPARVAGFYCGGLKNS